MIFENWFCRGEFSSLELKKAAPRFRWGNYWSTREFSGQDHLFYQDVLLFEYLVYHPDEFLGIQVLKTVNMPISLLRGFASTGYYSSFLSHTLHPILKKPFNCCNRTWEQFLCLEEGGGWRWLFHCWSWGYIAGDSSRSLRNIWTMGEALYFVEPCPQRLEIFVCFSGGNFLSFVKLENRFSVTEKARKTIWKRTIQSWLKKP